MDWPSMSSNVSPELRPIICALPTTRLTQFPAVATLAGQPERIAVLPLMHLLTITTCPEPWIQHDLYLIHDGTTVFYVGQSGCAFTRVWRHLQDGFKGRSLVGKFVRVNWPRSHRFTVELMPSRTVSTDDAMCDNATRDRAEQELIGALQPCFNETHNARPTPVPPGYKSPQATVSRPRHIKTMMREAEQAWQQATNRSAWEPSVSGLQDREEEA